MKGISMFSGAGIGETYLENVGVSVIAANEIVPRRAALYRKIYPTCDMVCGDILDNEVFEQLMVAAEGIEFMIASPPCQGMSIAGKSRCQTEMIEDPRNFLVLSVVKAIDRLRPKYILIENVSALLRIKLPYENELCSVLQILDRKFGCDYDIDGRIVDAADFGVPQTRQRAIIKMSEKGTIWNWPEKVEKKVTVCDAIGDLPSLEAGEKSSIRWHYARKHDLRHIEWMKHTKTGTSAFENEVYYPQKQDGTRIKGYESSYRRIRWDEPAPTITIRNDAISSQRNVHPGRLKDDGTYSDARVLTPYELMLLSSLPSDWSIPDDTPEILIRQVIGEAIPPLMIEKIVGEIK